MITIDPDQCQGFDHGDRDGSSNKMCHDQEYRVPYYRLPPIFYQKFDRLSFIFDRHALDFSG